MGSKPSTPYYQVYPYVKSDKCCSVCSCEAEWKGIYHENSSETKYFVCGYCTIDEAIDGVKGTCLNCSGVKIENEKQESVWEKNVPVLLAMALTGVGWEHSNGKL